MLIRRFFYLLCIQLVAVCIPTIIVNLNPELVPGLNKNHIFYFGILLSFCFYYLGLVKGYRTIEKELRQIRGKVIITALTFIGFGALGLFLFFTRSQLLNNHILATLLSVAILISSYAAVLELFILAVEEKDPIHLLLLLIPLSVQLLSISYLTTYSQIYGYPILTHLLVN